MAENGAYKRIPRPSFLLCVLIVSSSVLGSTGLASAVTQEMHEGFVIGYMPAGPMGTYTYVVGCLKTGVGAMIDATGSVPEMVQFANSHGLRLTKLFQTHEHFDHTFALSEAKAVTGGDIYAHVDALRLWDWVPGWASPQFGSNHKPAHPDHYIQDGQVLEVGELRFIAIATPGHAPGHVCFYEKTRGILFGGDLIIQGTIGRTDLQGADKQAMRASLQSITTLPRDAVLYSGHSPPTTLGEQLQSNYQLIMAVANTQGSPKKEDL